MTDAGRREVRRRKYLSLGVGELAAAVVFAVVLPRLVGDDDRRALRCALIPLLVVLVQAGSYWLLARGWVGRRSMPASLATVYRGFRWADALLLIGGLVGVLLWLPAGGRSVVVVGAIWVFGLVEYVNYFVVRLAYPSADGHAVCVGGVLPSWSRTCGRRPRHPRPDAASPADEW